jgi:type IV pilus assembly protein PilO
VGIVAILAAGWFLLVSGKRSEVKNLNSRAAAQASTNHGLQNQIKKLQSEKKDLPKQKALLGKLQVQLPNNPALPTLVRDLSRAADEAGVNLLSIAPEPPAALAVSAASSTASSPRVSNRTVVDQPSRPARTAVAPVSDLQFIGLQIHIAGGYFQTERFLAAIEDLKRVTLVNTVELDRADTPGDAPSPTGAAVTDEVSRDLLDVNVTARVFMVAQPVAAAPGAKTSTATAPRP